MTQAQSQTRYLLSDGLGSIRQMTNESGQVVAGYEYDPYGNPIGRQESGYGYTGEFWQSELGLLHLRARWYDPSTGSFLSKDRVESELPYQYVRGNPINWVDPSGFFGESPRIPNNEEWKGKDDSLGFAWEYSISALQRLVGLRSDIIVTAQRHGFVPAQLCSATPQQKQLLYALAAMTYRESLGYDEEIATGKAFLQESMALYGISGPDGLPSIGIVQMRPNTARELEQKGLVYEPSPNYKLGFEFGTGSKAYIPENSIDYFGNMGMSDQSQNPVIKPGLYSGQTSRLLQPEWAIEYLAANMENARSHINYWEPPDPNGTRLSYEWERMAGWHNRGVVNINNVPPQRRDDFWVNELQPYLSGTWRVMQVIEKYDLLGLQTMCNQTCNELVDTSH